MDATPEELGAFLADLRTKLETGDVCAKRTLLQRFIERLEYGPSGLVITYRQPDSCV